MLFTLQVNYLALATMNFRSDIPILVAAATMIRNNCIPSMVVSTAVIAGNVINFITCVAVFVRCGIPSLMAITAMC